MIRRLQRAAGRHRPGPRGKPFPGAGAIAPMLLVLVGSALPAGPVLRAQQEADSVDRRPNRLFRDDRPIEMVIQADFRQLFRDRDTMEVKRVAGRLTWRAPEGDEGEMPVELATRGHSRLLPAVCEFPPLRVFLPTGEERPRLWRGQPSLKLSVNCKPRRREYEQFVLEEYLLYRAYNLLTDLSYRTRLARATYLQQGSADTVASTWAFFVEDPDDMAERNGGEDFRQMGVRFRDVDSTTMALVGLYNYMLGNTDWALQVLHNVRVVKVPPGFYHPVPYDFDFSGLMKTPYARPSPQLGIRDVQERLYRGPCLSLPFLQTAFAPFVQHRETIYQLFRGQDGLDPKRVERHLHYLDDFYQVITDPRKAEREFRYNCR